MGGGRWEEGFEFGEDETRVEVDVPSYCEEGDPPVGDPE